jgi:DNA-binding IclR family transcriptional regulator
MYVIANHVHDMNESTVKSAQRALEVLEFFAEWRRPATVKEISTTLGYPQSSTSMLLRGMKESGYFDHDARTGMYAPNVRIALATAWISQQLYSEQSLLRLMEKVLSETGHTVMIGARQGVHVRYLHVLQATRAGSFTAKTGALRPLFRSATGKMLLTTILERDVSRLLRRANALEVDESLRVTIDDVLAARKASLATGYAISRGTALAGAAALAVLLPVPSASEALTLSLGGPIAEIDAERERLIAVLRSSILPFREAAQSAATR